MTTYILQQLECGRIVLDTERHRKSEILRTIEADSWLEAREQIEPYEFIHRPGLGFFTE